MVLFFYNQILTKFYYIAENIWGVFMTQYLYDFFHNVKYMQYLFLSFFIFVFLKYISLFFKYNDYKRIKDTLAGMTIEEYYQKVVKSPKQSLDVIFYLLLIAYFGYMIFMV